MKCSPTAKLALTISATLIALIFSNRLMAMEEREAMECIQQEIVEQGKDYFTGEMRKKRLITNTCEESLKIFYCYSKDQYMGKFGGGAWRLNKKTCSTGQSQYFSHSTWLYPGRTETVGTMFGDALDIEFAVCPGDKVKIKPSGDGGYSCSPL